MRCLFFDIILLGDDMSNYFIIHGSFSSPFSNWIPYLRGKLESLDRSVYTPDLPSGVGYQSYDSWKKIMDGYVECGLLNENTIIFAHSIGPVFISKYLIEKKLKVKRLVYVCGFNNYLGIDDDYDAVNESMYLDNLNDIKNYCKDIICMYSDNDPYVKMDVEKEFAESITDNIIVYPGGGHLNSESGYQEFGDLLKYVEE